MNPDETLERVRRCIADVLAMEVAEIAPQQSLVDDLGAESLDFLDLIYRLEQEFAIAVSRRELDLLARFGVDHEEENPEVLSEAAIARLLAAAPHLDPTRLRPGMSRFELARLITVGDVAAMIAGKLAVQPEESRP